MLDAGSKLTAYQDEWHVRVGSEQGGPNDNNDKDLAD